MNVKLNRYLSKSVIHLILVLLGFCFLFPFFWVISTSLKSDLQLYVIPPIMFPSPPQWGNYLEAMSYIPYFRYLFNTILVACLDSIGTILMTPIAGYGLSRLKWKGQNTVLLLTIAVMMIPGEVTMISLFIMYSKTGLVGTYVPLVLQSFFGRPFMIFLCRQFFMRLPKDLEDAARIDGLSEFMIYWRIMRPLAMASILTVALFRFMNAWGDFIGPMLYLNKNSMYTLTIGLQMFSSQYETLWQLMMAATALTTLPVIILYFFVQKRFIQGIAFTGIKG